MRAIQPIVLAIIGAASVSADALAATLATLAEDELREVHALYYAARDGMSVDDARAIDAFESCEVVEEALLGRQPQVLARFLGAALARGLVL